MEVQSVDRVQKDPGSKRPICIPYYYLRTAINEKRLCLYDKCDLLTEELLNLERKADGHIDHPTNGCFTGDTLVSLVDGRELSMLELVNEYKSGKNNFVYSFNEAAKK